jgi:hypothetical protein
METEIRLESRYRPTEDVVAREVMGKILIVPLTSGIGDMEDEIYTLNESGRRIWDRLAKGHSVRTLIESLSSDFEAEAGEIERDVTGLMKELIKRRMIEEAPDA